MKVLKKHKYLHNNSKFQIHEPIVDVLSKDPALVGYDTTRYLFTDITFGVANEHRTILERYILNVYVYLIHIIVCIN